MEEDTSELKSVKSMLRSVLISCKEGVLAATLQKEYKEMVGDYIPYKKFGCSSLEEFIQAVPDVVRVSRRGPDFVCHAVADQSTAHIQKLVSKQRSKKLKKPVRRPRGGGGGFPSRPPGRPRTSYQPRSPATPSPSRNTSTQWRRYNGMPRVMFNNTELTPVIIQVGNSSTGSRTIHMGPSRLLTKAVTAANSERTQQRYENKKTFETPPRFLKKSENQQSQAPQVQPSHQSTPRRQQAKREKEFPTIQGGEKYVKQLHSYLRENNQSLDFETVAAYGGYVSSILINNMTYGSEDVYSTAQEAEQAAAMVAMSRIDTRKQASSLPEIDWDNTSNYSAVLNWADDDNSRVSSATQRLPEEKLQKVKSQVKELLRTKKNGVWGSVIPFMFKNTFKEEAPAGLLELIKTWKDIFKVEIVPNTDRDIVYPVEGSENKDLNIPYEPLIKSCDSKYIVYMTDIHHLSYFSVQLEESVIDTISEQLQIHCKSISAPDPSLLEKDQYCAAIFSGDGSWTRAQILNVRDDRCVQVVYVDYGNVEVVKMESLRWLSPELANYPVQAITCSLYGVEPLEGETDWNAKSLEVFSTLVKDEALEAIPKSIYDNIVEVDLYVQSSPSESISDKLAKAGVVKNVREKIETLEKMDPETIKLPEDKLWDVHITFINNSTNSLMVRLVGEDFSEKLDAFQSQLQHAFRRSDSNAPIVEGMIYVAFDDELYQRVRVVAMDGKKVTCYFPDHGDTDKLLPEQLRPLDPTINRLLPYQAVEVSLYDLEDVASNMTTINKLVELALDKSCVAELIEREDVPSVILYDTSNEEDININEKILEAIEAEGGGIDSSGSASSTPKRIISPVPSEQQIVPKRSDLSPVTGEGTNIQTSLNTQFTGSGDSGIPKFANMSISENSSANPINIDTPGKSKLASPYIPPIPSESPPKSGDFEIKLEPQNTPDVSNVFDYKESSNPTQNTGFAKPDLLTNIKEEVIEQIITKKAQYTARTLPAYSIPPVGKYLDLHVKLIHDPSNFRCLPYEELNNLSELFQDMYDYYSGKVPMMMMREDIKLGSLYAGQKDMLWYRVRVADFSNIDLVVYLVDAGEHVVMSLDDIQPLYNQFCKLPCMAINATLGGIEPCAGIWSEAAKYKFIELALERDLIGLILDEDKNTGKISVRLIDTAGDQDVCIDEVLISMDYAKVSEK